MNERLPTEDELQGVIVDTAQLRGYLVHHVRPAATSKGYRTPLQGDKGFPDLVIVGRGACFVWELKSATGAIEPEQSLWLRELAEAFVEATLVDVRVVTPGLLDDALRALELGSWPSAD